MKHSSRLGLLLFAGVMLCAGFSAAVVSDQETQSLKKWAEAVWSSAQRGDRGALEGYLGRLPKNVEAHANAARLREVLDQHQLNTENSLANRAENREKATATLHERLDKGEIAQALTAAVEVQTLADDQAAVLEKADLGRVVAAAKRRIPKVEAQGDWLHAYELLYRLNVLYEHTGEYEKDLDRVNRRLALLSYYAPRHLHMLRSKQAQRFDGEELEPFNPALVEDNNQRLKGLTTKMVRGALDRAAREHIESRGWRPLLVGGIEGLRMFATTPALSETFEGLQNRAAVARWTGRLDEERARLDGTADDDLGYRACSRLLGDLVDLGGDLLDLPRAVVLREFGDGAMHELDKFSEVIWPDKYHRFRQSTHGSFVGVGIVIRHDDNREILVVSPVEGTPAYYAGVKPNDRIAQVDSVPTSGWSLNDAVDKITGKEGTRVTLGIRREGQADLLQLPIVRDVIKIHSVKGWWKSHLDDNGDPVWNWYIDPDTRIAYIRLTGFNEDTFRDLMSAWNEIVAEGAPTGLILDLRYNPGGLLVSAVEVSNMFVPHGVIVSGETKEGRKAWPDRRAEPHKAVVAEAAISTIVLVNEGSASASEIVAGCLQAHDAAVVVGMRTYGKGSVQTVHQISRQALLKLTTQYYRLPPTEQQRALGEKGRLVHRRSGATQWGVEPDIVVRTTPQEIKAAYDLRQAADIISRGLGNEEGEAEEPVRERPDINELLTKGSDPQLETALLILRAKALGSVTDDTRHARAD